ncbi:MAG TPA: DUF3185 family protein [Opitutus sp.]|nr:DUF3185 family protein [Opitutus sp.]
MGKTISIILLVLGIVLIAYGVSGTQSLGSEVSEQVTGAPTNHSMWLLGGGIVLGLIGLVGLFRRPRG